MEKVTSTFRCQSVTANIDKSQSVSFTPLVKDTPARINGHLTLLFTAEAEGVPVFTPGNDYTVEFLLAAE